MSVRGAVVCCFTGANGAKVGVLMCGVLLFLVQMELQLE